VLAALVAVLRPQFVGAIGGPPVVSRKLRRHCAEVADDLILPDGRGLRHAQTTLRVLGGLPQVFVIRLMRDNGNDEIPQCPT